MPENNGVIYTDAVIRTAQESRDKKKIKFAHASYSAFVNAINNMRRKRAERLARSYEKEIDRVVRTIDHAARTERKVPENLLIQKLEYLELMGVRLVKSEMKFNRLQQADRPKPIKLNKQFFKNIKERVSAWKEYKKDEKEVVKEYKQETKKLFSKVESKMPLTGDDFDSIRISYDSSTENQSVPEQVVEQQEPIVEAQTTNNANSMFANYYRSQEPQTPQANEVVEHEAPVVEPPAAPAPSSDNDDALAELAVEEVAEQEILDDEISQLVEETQTASRGSDSGLGGTEVQGVGQSSFAAPELSIDNFYENATQRLEKIFTSPTNNPFVVAPNPLDVKSMSDDQISSALSSLQAEQDLRAKKKEAEANHDRVQRFYRDDDFYMRPGSEAEIARLEAIRAAALQAEREANILAAKTEAFNSLMAGTLTPDQIRENVKLNWITPDQILDAMSTPGLTDEQMMNLGGASGIIAKMAMERESVHQEPSKSR